VAELAQLGLGRVYRTLLGSRIRSQLSYRASFVVDTLNAFGVGVLEYVEIYVVLSNVPLLGGLNLVQASFVFALANLGFALGDLVFGQLDAIPTLVRMGRLEALLVRPMSVMTQLITADFQLRRLGRASVGLVILAIVVGRLGVHWTPETVYLLLVTPVFGALIYGALFATAGGVQFFLIDGAEFTSSFVYGGSYAGQLPGSVLIPALRVAFTFLVPATVTAYLPALVIMGLPGLALLPSCLGWWAPVFALWSWLLATLAWRAGIGHYTGAGG
jgi:ABC-2 type transport system permease protein